MSLQASVPELLAALAQVLRTLGVRWYLFGAQAAVLWGRPRLSADVDATAEVPPERALELVAAMARGGFDLRLTRDVEGFVARTRVLPFVERASGIPLDIILAGPGFEEEFLDRAVSIRVGAADIPVISPEDLIVTKILAGREKDLEDIRGVLAERLDRLDIARIRETLSLLEQALGQSDLTPLFEQQLRGRDGG